VNAVKVRRWGVLVLLVLVLPGLALAAAQPFAGRTVTLGVFAGGTRGAISGPFYYFRSAWEQLTGARLNIVEIPFDQLPTKIKTDLITRAGRFDGFVPCATIYGDLVTNNWIVPVDPWIRDPRFPRWNPNDMGPPIRQLYQWGGKQYGANYDADAWVLYGRRDLLNDPKEKAAFRAKYGYELRLPRTIKELLDVSEFFNNRDWNGDGRPDFGIVLPLKVSAQGFFFYLAFAAPYVVVPGPTVDEYHNVFFFNPRTMEPIINSPGHVKALEDYIRLTKNGPRAQLGWDLVESWDPFLKGNAALTYSPGDIGSLSKNPDRSRIKGKLTAGPMPASTEYYDRQSNRWVQKLNRVGNLLGCSWHGLVSTLSKNKETIYHLFAYMAERPRLFQITTFGWGGVDPGKIYDFPPEVSDGQGTGSVQAYIRQGFDRRDALDWLSAYWQNYYKMDAWQEYLRIPGAPELINSLDLHLSQALVGKETPKQALDAVAKEWNDIVNKLGRDKLRRAYQESIGYGKPAPRYRPR
jgi:multiple sugar transport system substrate-binding protein